MRGRARPGAFPSPEHAPAFGDGRVPPGWVTAPCCFPSLAVPSAPPALCSQVAAVLRVQQYNTRGSSSAGCWVCVLLLAESFPCPASILRAAPTGCACWVTGEQEGPALWCWTPAGQGNPAKKGHVQVSGSQGGAGMCVCHTEPAAGRSCCPGRAPGAALLGGTVTCTHT